MSSDQVWSITSRLPPLTQQSTKRRTIATFRSCCVSFSASSILRLLAECEFVLAQCGGVERGGDPAGCAVGGKLAERCCDVREGVWALGPDVEVGSAAGELPACGHQDRFVAEWVEVADREQAGGIPVRSLSRG